MLLDKVDGSSHTRILGFAKSTILFDSEAFLDLLKHCNFADTEPSLVSLDMSRALLHGLLEPAGLEDHELLEEKREFLHDDGRPLDVLAPQTLLQVAYVAPAPGLRIAGRLHELIERGPSPAVLIDHGY